MLKEFYNNNNLNDFLDFNTFSTLTTLNIPKGSDIFVDSLYFLVEGEVELFLTNDRGDNLKITNLNNTRPLIGTIERLDYLDTTLTYKARTDIIIIKIDRNLLNNLLNNIYFLTWCNKHLFKNLIEVSNLLLLRTNYSSTDILKNILINEMDKDGEVLLSNSNDFYENYKISRSAFYKGLKELESSGDLIKDGNKLIIK